MFPHPQNQTEQGIEMYSEFQSEGAVMRFHDIGRTRMRLLTVCCMSLALVVALAQSTLVAQEGDIRNALLWGGIPQPERMEIMIGGQTS